MRRAVVILVVLMVPVVVSAQLDWYPRTTLAEDATATWCGYCPYAYSGLDVVHATYDYSVFVSARYYATSGGLGTAETDAAIAYMDIGGFPTVVFNGTDHIVGGSPTIAAGGPYLNVVGSSSLSPAPVSVVIDSFDAATGDISVTVTMFSTTDSFVGDHIRFLLLENDVNVPENYSYVTRDIINDSITLDGGQGATAAFSHTFDTSLVGNSANAHAVVFVQRAADKEVVQAASSKPVPDYRVRAMAPFSRLKIGESSGTYTSEHFTVLNVGLSDDYTANLIIDEAPAGWTVQYCDDGDNCYSTAMPLSLVNDASTEYYVKVMPTSPGFMNYHFQVDSTSNGSSVTVPFSYFTNDIDVLVVDDDGGQSYEDYFTEALDSVGITYGVWDLAKGGLTDEVAQTFSLLVWSAGAGYPGEDARTYLRDHLDNGNSLFITGQDIGWGLCDPSSNKDCDFVNDYLHASYVRDDTNIMDLDGVLDDPVSNGLQLHIAGGDGASNQAYPEEIAAFDGDAVEIFDYVGNYCGAVRSFDSTSGARVVYLGFGFEAIDNPADRSALMGSAVFWLQGGIFSDGFESGGMTAWSTSIP